MLKRIYIDNYKSLVNFEISVGPINLFLGPNGGGKSAVFEALRLIRNFVRGFGKVTNLFYSRYCTRWQDSQFLQTFELDIEQDKDIYKYELSIEYGGEGGQARVNYERLWFNDKPLLKFEDGDVQLYRDDHSEGPRYPFDWSRSAVDSIAPRRGNERLTWFKEQLEHFTIIAQPIPLLIFEGSSYDQEEPFPSTHLENYVSWYRYLSQDQSFAYRLTDELRKILPGFDYFKFEPVAKLARLLKVYFRSADGQSSIGYRFDELSDGQRMLIALYTLIHVSCTDKQHKYTLCLDEPENFVGLPEIQPWLTELYDRCLEGEIQAILISHHPELINYLLASPVGYWFDRQSNGPTRVKPITDDAREGLPISELVARGWLSNE